MVQGGCNAPSAAGAGLKASITESDVCTVLGNWLESIFPSTTIIRKGQQNQSAPPNCSFALMTIINRERLATNGWDYTETTRNVTEQTKFSVQVSVFGKGAGDLIQAATALWRDMNAVDFFAASGMPIAPLYASDPRQLGFINAEKQYEDNWSADFQLQANITLNVPQQFADKLTIDTIEVDTTYPPKE